MAQRGRVQIGDRDIHIVTGRVSQTVNVCDANNRLGEYDYVIRLFQPNFIDGNNVQNRTDVDDLIQWLTQARKGQVEQSPPTITPVVPSVPGPQPLSPADDLWVQRAMQITEICINELVREFLDLPYLHRVEHSIHTRLHAILSVQPHFSRHFPIAHGSGMTQPIHKEWPESIPRAEKGTRRGNFDLAILPPDLLNGCNLKDFSEGRIAPPIVIEMGLNYGNGHLAGDAEKLLNSQVKHAYLVHLVREMPHDTSIDQTIADLRRTNLIRVAFARVEQGRKYLKLLDDSMIQPV